MNSHRVNRHFRSFGQRGYLSTTPDESGFMTKLDGTATATLLAGIPAENMNLYRKIRFVVGDPAAAIDLPGANGERQTTLIIRDIELARARRYARADEFACPADFAPDGGLSGDRETATAQSVAEFLRRSGVEVVVADRSLPFIFAHFIHEAGMRVHCEPELGVIERRAKDPEEISHLRESQRLTEEAIRTACELIAEADAGADGVLQVEGEPLTAERVRRGIDLFLAERGYQAPPSIIAGGSDGADCHNNGSGPLRTGEPVIVDIFPRNRETLYYGDCTRTVVHGSIPPELAKMRDAVAAAKEAAIAAVRPGVTGEAIHEVTARTLTQHGYEVGRPDEVSGDGAAMVHGTGHGVGLEVHEPPLLDRLGPELVVGDVLTVEPGLYRSPMGGVRLEDMIVVTEDGCENFNSLPEGLSWG